MSRPPKVRDDLVEHRPHRLGVREVRSDDQGLDAQRAQLVRELLGARRLVAEVDDDVRAGLGEVADGVGSDAARRTGDEGGLALQRVGDERLGHGAAPGGSAAGWGSCRPVRPYQPRALRPVLGFHQGAKKGLGSGAGSHAVHVDRMAGARGHLHHHRAGHARIHVPDARGGFADRRARREPPRRPLVAADPGGGRSSRSCCSSRSSRSCCGASIAAIRTPRPTSTRSTASVDG